MSNVEETLVLVKPDGVSRNLTGEILRRIEAKGSQLVDIKLLQASRELLGPPDSGKAAPGTIRGDLGVDVMVYVCHASDSADAAKAELARFFRPEELFSYELAPVAFSSG